ncbi:cobalamin-binding protein [Metabacillus arenae]|uniref:Cobalamin-binding protein n=1 Tax=Metabacillus arenae TaxID=2771434 RepID=A0A926NN30_9BACI|nr:cobalamin-binding protein [Metabacillus arenae]MBD1380841.1 cobalamin-binding protein [Metabacillus arenae]
MRIISICPSNTELLGYLNLTKHIVAVDDYSDWPNEVHSLPRLGPDLSINMDLVEEMKPDLVLASLSVPGMEKNILELEKRKIPHVVLNPQSLNEIAEDLVKVGELTGQTEYAKKAAHSFHQFISTYRGFAQKINQPKSVYFEWWPKPIFTPGKKNWLTEIAELAGAKNVFHHEEQASVQTDWDEVLTRNPDHICMCWVGVEEKRMKKEHVLKREQADTLHAVQEGNIHLLEEALFCRPSPRLLLGLKKLAPLLNPNVFPAHDGREPLDHFR